MKSIMEEASSVFKAVEKAWTQAGKPQEFSIKVFEEPVKNFLGFTTKPAKIAIFFEDKPQPRAQHTSRPHPQPRKPAPASHTPHAPAPAREAREITPKQPKPAPLARPIRTPEQPKEPRQQPWNDEMISAAKVWVDELMASMGKRDKTFTLSAKNYYLKLSFDSVVMNSGEEDRQLFRSIAYLIMQSLRNKFKKSLRGYKIIVSGPNSGRPEQQ